MHSDLPAAEPTTAEKILALPWSGASTAYFQAITLFINIVGRAHNNSDESFSILRESSRAFASGEFLLGIDLITRAVQQIPEDRYNWAGLRMLRD